MLHRPYRSGIRFALLKATLCYELVSDSSLESVAPRRSVIERIRSRTSGYLFHISHQPLQVITLFYVASIIRPARQYQTSRACSLPISQSVGRSVFTPYNHIICKYYVASILEYYVPLRHVSQPIGLPIGQPVSRSTHNAPTQFSLTIGQSVSCNAIRTLVAVRVLHQSSAASGFELGQCAS